MNTYARTIAACLCSTLLASPALAASFSGASHDITDFTNGSEVSTRGTFIEAVKLLNENIGGLGVSATVNGVLFKGTQPGAVSRRGRGFCERILRLSRRRQLLRQRFVDLRWGLRRAG